MSESGTSRQLGQVTVLPQFRVKPAVRSHRDTAALGPKRSLTIRGAELRRPTTPAGGVGMQIVAAVLRGLAQRGRLAAAST
jgi:hypothetical protein